MTLLHDNSCIERITFENATMRLQYVLSAQQLLHNDLFTAPNGTCWHAGPRKLKQVNGTLCYLAFRVKIT